MFTQLSVLKKGYQNYLIRKTRAEARDTLLAQSDRALEDIGISRELLLKGVKGWPWKVNTEQAAQIVSNDTLNNQKRSISSLIFNRVDSAEAQAIRELKSYSDKELQDLGISRGMIVEAVKNGITGRKAGVAPSLNNDVQHSSSVEQNEEKQAA